MKSPLNRCAKIFSFVILIFSLFGVLLPSLASKLIFSAYNLIFKPLFAYQTTLGFSTIKSIVSILITSLSIIILSVGSFFSSLDWQQNAISLTFLTLILIFIIGSPCIQHFKSNQIEIEIRPPPAFELTPSLIEKKLKDITENFVTITEKYDYPNINEVFNKKR